MAFIDRSRLSWLHAFQVEEKYLKRAFITRNLTLCVSERVVVSSVGAIVPVASAGATVVVPSAEAR